MPGSWSAAIFKAIDHRRSSAWSYHGGDGGASGSIVDGGPQRQRLDILGIDADGRLVVAELSVGWPRILSKCRL